MAYNNNNNNNNVRNDKFGNPYELKTAYAQKTKDGEVLPIYRTFVEVAGKLLQIDISERKKETKDGTPAMWVKVTSKKKQTRSSSL